jgi:hypothetical protein
LFTSEMAARNVVRKVLLNIQWKLVLTRNGNYSNETTLIKNDIDEVFHAKRRIGNN